MTEQWPFLREIMALVREFRALYRFISRKRDPRYSGTDDMSLKGSVLVFCDGQSVWHLGVFHTHKKT